MAKKSPTPASFVKGDPRAALARAKSSANTTPPELKILRKEKGKVIELAVYKYIDMALPELKSTYERLDLPAIDRLVIKCLMGAIDKGDFLKIEPMLQRSLGKVKDEIEHTIHKPSILVKRNGEEVHFLNGDSEEDEGE